MTSRLLVVAALATLASAHGYMAGIVSKGSNANQPRPARTGLGDGNAVAIPTDCRGCSLSSDQYEPDHAIKEDAWTTDAVRCANFAKPDAGTAPSITVAAGETIEVAWDIPIAHPGPAALYMSFDGDETWVLLAQVVDPFIGLVPGRPNVWDGSAKLNGNAPNWKITMPKNLPASTRATLRGEWWNTQAPELYVTCIDIATTGPGALPADGFPIRGTPDGPSHLPRILAHGTPYPAYKGGTDYVTNGIGWANYVGNVYRGELGGPELYNFGKDGVADFAVNVQMTIEDPAGGNTPINFPGDLKISDMNPVNGVVPGPTMTTTAAKTKYTPKSTPPPTTAATSTPKPTTTTTTPQQGDNDTPDGDEFKKVVVVVTKTVTVPAAAKRTPTPMLGVSKRRARRDLRRAYRG